MKISTIIASETSQLIVTRACSKLVFFVKNVADAVAPHFDDAAQFLIKSKIELKNGNNTQLIEDYTPALFIADIEQYGEGAVKQNLDGYTVFAVPITAGGVASSSYPFSETTKLVVDLKNLNPDCEYIVYGYESPNYTTVCHNIAKKVTAAGITSEVFSLSGIASIYLPFESLEQVEFVQSTGRKLTFSKPELQFMMLQENDIVEVTTAGSVNNMTYGAYCNVAEYLSMDLEFSNPMYTFLFTSLVNVQPSN